MCAQRNAELRRNRKREEKTRDFSKLLMNSRHTEPAQLPFPGYYLTMVRLVSQFLGLHDYGFFF